MDKTMRPILDSFGKLLMEKVRDDACGFLQRVISGKMIDATSKDLYAQFRSLSQNDSKVLMRFLTVAVDSSIVRFLHFLDVNEIEVVFRDDGGEKYDVRAISDGLAGELYSESGWINKFSSFGDRIEPL